MVGARASPTNLASSEPPREWPIAVNGDAGKRARVCATARRKKDFEGCLRSAHAAIIKDSECGKAWAFLCWALFELHRYDEAQRETHRAPCLQLHHIHRV